jgi:hypothetical protein
MTKCDLVQPEDLARRHALTAEALSKYSKGIKTIRLVSAPRPTQTPPPSPFSLFRSPVTRSCQEHRWRAFLSPASPVLAPAHNLHRPSSCPDRISRRAPRAQSPGQAAAERG